MLKNSWRFFVAGFQLLTCFALGAATPIPSVEKLLPDDTLLVLTTPDFTKMRDIYHTSPQTQFWNDPAMKPFKENFLAKMHENLIQPLERDMGVDFNDYTNLPQGQITFAITQNGWPATQGQQPGMLFLMDTKDKGDQLKKNLVDLRKKWIDAGKTVRTEKIRNIDFSVIAISEKDIPKTLRKFSNSDSDGDSDSDSDNKDTPPSFGTTNAPNNLYVGQYESLLILGTSAKPIEKVLVHLTGGQMPALGDLAAYDANRLAMFREAPLYGWANTKAFMDLLAQREGKDNPEDPFAMLNPVKILTAAGFTSLKTIAFSVQVANDGSTVQLFASMPESSRQGIFTVFPGQSKDSSPPSFVPADAVKFQRWRVDGQKAWTALQQVLAGISPQAKSGINFMIDTANTAAREKDPDFDMNKNFFGNLGDDIMSYQKAPRGNTPADPNSAPSIFLIGSPNPDQLVSAFKFLLVLANPQSLTPKEREFLGRKIYTVELGGGALPGASPSGPATRSLSYVAGSSYVAVSTDDSLLEEYLRSSDSTQKTLRDTPGLTDAVAKVNGTSAGVFGYENQVETTRAVFESLRNNASTNGGFGSASPGIPGIAALPNTDSIRSWMDFSLLPPFDKISKYFSFSVYSISADSDGIKFKMYAPVPGALRK